MRDLTISGTLPQGVEVDGAWHRDFVLRLPTVADNIEAVDQVGTGNAVALSAAILSRQLVKLGALQDKALTYDLVTGLHPQDYNHLEAAAAELEKKRQAALAARPNGQPSASPCAAPA